ncbi:hypothetical protein [Paenisporosarcina antarctica]|uniref:Uncharacterized protein n=1 Tax=Paenisporosarcina antarctica TaxID=417367 RepID=A0A4P7A1F5_9BACL|nr:hypothetical protein [Paenisporosarcina antarctica]QBP42860.1 hypothetical protein E2636_17700 [Paenisporosarcina antarctica]
MIKSLAIVLVGGVIFIIKVPPLVKKKQKKEIVVFSSLLIIGVGLSITYAIGKTIPNPLDFITFMLKPLSDLISLLVE